jgi:hypothetical protein
VAFWWVNQGQTWDREIPGEYLWSPKKGKNGSKIFSYEMMTQLEVGDIVFSYFKGSLHFAGVVAHRAISSRKPDFGFSGNVWDDDGWSVDMRYVELPTPFKPTEDLSFYNQAKPERYGPIDVKGKVVTQYLFPLTQALGHRYLELGGLTQELILDELRIDPTLDAIDGDIIFDQAASSNSNDLTYTERKVLARARRGQGLFKSEVQKVEPSCRLTGVTESRHLIASHIKPWASSNNQERLDGENGLLLSPHVDHLFDRGLITFRGNGSVVASPRLNSVIVSKWKLDLTAQGRPFKGRHYEYLEYHQELIFKSA